MKDNFDLILFDLDGTLTDSSEGITKSIQYALGKHGIEEPDLENLRKFIGPPLVPAFMECYGVTEDEAHSIRNTFNERYVPIGWKENRPYDGIEAVLESIQTEGKMLGIATSKPQETADKVLEYFDLKKYFTVLCGAPMNGKNGDKAGRIRAAIAEAKKLGCEVKKPVLVGDTKFDVNGAHECGIPFIGVSWGFALEGEFESCNTEYVVDTMEELLDILK